MKYTCQYCGVTAEISDDLCNPILDGQGVKFCNTPSDRICDDKQEMMAYKCDACGSLAADGDHLCFPKQDRH